MIGDVMIGQMLLALNKDLSRDLNIRNIMLQHLNVYFLNKYISLIIIFDPSNITNFNVKIVKNTNICKI